MREGGGRERQSAACDAAAPLQAACWAVWKAMGAFPPT